MLNRIKKNLITAVLAGTMCLTLPAFALDSTVSYVNINDRAYQDVEIVITDNNQILVPFKQLADLFNIKYEANRVDKKISFTTFDGKEGMITQNGIYVEDTPIAKFTPVFVQSGIMDGVFNEAYLPADAVAKVMGISLTTDFETLTLNATVDRDIPLLANTNTYTVDENSPRAYKDIVAPKKQGKITLNMFELRSNMMADSLTVKTQDYKSLNDTFSGNTTGAIYGNIFGGKYKVEATEYHYRNDAFMFGGLSASYRNSFTAPSYKNIKTKRNDKLKYFYELGKIGGIKDGEMTMGTNVFGAQVWDWDNQKISPKEISGYVKPTSLVRLTANDQEPVILSTYAGYYTLRDVQLPNPTTRIKLEEINEDGTEELIMDERYNIFGDDTPFEKEQRVTAYTGVWGYQDRLFREGSNIYRGNNKKVTAAGEYQLGLKDNLTFKSKASGDLLYKKNGVHLVDTLPTHDSLLVTGTQKSVNYQQGVSSVNSLEWKSEKVKELKARLDGGVSVAKDYREHNTHLGWMGKLTGEYDKDLHNYSYGLFKPNRLYAKLEGFHTAPDWYIASSDSTSRNDRTGGRATGGFSFNSTNVSGGYARWLSNLNRRYEGGRIVFDEANIGASTRIPKVMDLRFNTYYRHGENHLGRNKNYNYEVAGIRTFGNWLKLEAGMRESVYDTKYWHPSANDYNYYTKHDDIYQQFEWRIPHNLGTYRMGHDFVRYKTATYRNGYNMFTFGYTFPTWKRFTLGVQWGFHYYGEKGHELGASIAYSAPSGQTMAFNYLYSQNGGYFIDNMFMPTTNRHSFTFTFNDAFQIFHRGLKSVGMPDLNKGLFEAIAFIDIDGNGKFDRKVDIPVADVPISTDWVGKPMVTNKRGWVYSDSIQKGVYKVSINMNELPITVAPVTNDLIMQRVKIDGGQTTRLEIPLVSTVGSVSGTLKITDDFDRGLRLTDFVVVLLDENGNEVNYSTVGESGEFYISGLAPGKYKLQLDERFISAYGLEELPNSYIDVFIPYDYKNPTDLMDQNLEYKTLSL